jgi:hypothetical protein
VATDEQWARIEPLRRSNRGRRDQPFGDNLDDHDPQTRAYAEKRRAEGKTDREIRRILKRYLARSIYRHLNTASATRLGVDGI